MLFGQKGGSFTATALSKSVAERIVGTLSASLTTEGSPGMAAAERETLSSC